MKTYTLAVGTFKLNVQSGRKYTKRQEYALHVDWVTLYRVAGTINDKVVSLLVVLAAKHDAYLAEKHKMSLKDYPPHTIFCDCSTCERPVGQFYGVYDRKVTKKGKK